MYWLGVGQLVACIYVILEYFVQCIMQILLTESLIMYINTQNWCLYTYHTTLYYFNYMFLTGLMTSEYLMLLKTNNIFSTVLQSTCYTEHYNINAVLYLIQMTRVLHNRYSELYIYILQVLFNKGSEFTVLQGTWYCILVIYLNIQNYTSGWPADIVHIHLNIQSCTTFKSCILYSFQFNLRTT